jgi:hypothetical protein
MFGSSFGSPCPLNNIKVMISKRNTSTPISIRVKDVFKLSLVAYIVNEININHFSIA